MFAKFTLIWPRDWADKCAAAGNLDAMANEWADGLAGLTGEQMRTAIERCRATLKWAPSIAEFRDAGKSGMTTEQRAFFARAADEQPALPARTWAERRAEGRQQAQALLAALRGHEPDADDPERAARLEAAKQATLDALARLQRESVA